MTKPVNPTPFDFDLGKFLSDFRGTGKIDVDAVVQSQRKNVEALTEANKLAYEGMQAVFQRQMEILRHTAEEVTQASQTFAKPESPQELAAKQTELAKDAFERTLGNLRELSEMVAKSNSEAFELLNKRFAQGLDELRDLLLKAK
jgi:phasin family protein